MLNYPYRKVLALRLSSYFFASPSSVLVLLFRNRCPHLPSTIPFCSRAETSYLSVAFITGTRGGAPRNRLRLVNGGGRSATDAPEDPEADQPRARPKALPFTIDNCENKTELSMVNGGNDFEKEVRGQTKVRQRSTRTDEGPTPCDICGETFILISRPRRAKRAPPSVRPSV